MSDSGTGAGGALGDLAKRVGDDVSGLVQQEVETARTELTETAKQGAKGAGLLGGAALSGYMALLFGSIAVWRGLGNRIGFGRSALVVAAVYGVGAAVLSGGGGAALKDVPGMRRTVGSLRDLADGAASGS
jgi:hypothetical protein